jgi:hypothetical protein
MISFWKRSELDKIRRSKYLLPSDRLAKQLHRDTHEYNTFPPRIPHRDKTTYASIKVLLEPSQSRVARRGGDLT